MRAVMKPFPAFLLAVLAACGTANAPPSEGPREGNSTVNGQAPITGTGRSKRAAEQAAAGALLAKVGK